MNEKKISDARFSDTGYSYTLSLIAGKYKPIVLYCLMEFEPVRFNEMRRYLGNTADKTLMLLGYLYDHNVHHTSELDDLAERLKAEGRGEAAEKVLAAKECFGSGNDLLHEAIHMCE